MIMHKEILRILCYKTFGIAKNPKYDGYQCGLASMVYNFFNKRTSGSAIKKGNVSNKELAQELHKPIIKNFNKRKVQSGFKDDILGVDLGDMELISNFNR